mmetsp:Transcript_35924/g.61285  ORF Transcript_35924/g.61285 Transcript_35924/m.61285 type:complete len:130 (+) Transcript_35924:348-737(+)
MKRRQWEKAAEASNNGNYWQQNNVTEERQSVKIDEEREADMAHEEKSSGGSYSERRWLGCFLLTKRGRRSEINAETISAAEGTYRGLHHLQKTSGLSRRQSEKGTVSARKERGKRESRCKGRLKLFLIL